MAGVVDGSRQRAFWRKKGSFWGRLSTVVAAFCVFGILTSSSWTYTSQHALSMREVVHQVQVAQPVTTDRGTDLETMPVHIPPVPRLSESPPQLLVSEGVSSASSSKVTVPVLELDDEDDGQDDSSFADQQQGVVEGEQVATNLTSIVIGIISHPIEDIEFRAAARATWVRSVKGLGRAVDAVFFFTQEHALDAGLQDEASKHGDIVFGVGDASMPVAYQMLEQLSQQFATRHIMRVGVRSYVVANRLLARLEAVCARPGCAGEDIWAGRMITSREIPTRDYQYLQDTGLSLYLPYMSSGAYVLSTSVAQSLSLMHTEIGLKLYGEEDREMGVWLIPMAARRIDLGSAVHLETGCCFNAAGTMAFDVCARTAEQYPVVVGELAQPEYLKKYHNALLVCPDQNTLV